MPRPVPNPSSDGEPTQAPAPAAAPGGTGVAAAGKVWLVGAGPGDPELLTLKARRVLQGAESVFYDELVNAAILAWLPPECERLYVGKRDRDHALPQPEIVRLMIERARQGRSVVRLKGGDPFVFGRGGEEAEQLAAAGVSWELVPGISAGFAVPALAGIPVTHREVASGVVFRTGHRCAAAQASDPEPAHRDTQVIFMGLTRLAEIGRELIAAGWPPATPAAVIAHGSMPDQRIVTGTLADIAARARAAALTSPALVVVGEAVGLRLRLSGGAPEAAPGAPPPGLILMAHGSPLASWHESVERLCAGLAVGGRFVRSAYLPPATPQLADTVAQAAAAGLEHVVIVPYFLAEGLHVTRDIPDLVAAARARFPQLRLDLAASLDGHPALRTAILARAAECGS